MSNQAQQKQEADAIVVNEDARMYILSRTIKRDEKATPTGPKDGPIALETEKLHLFPGLSVHKASGLQRFGDVEGVASSLIVMTPDQFRAQTPSSQRAWIESTANKHALRKIAELHPRVKDLCENQIASLSKTEKSED